MNTEIFFHIGFPKTATTTLQEVLISASDCLYFGKGLREKMEQNTSRELTKYLIFATNKQSEIMRDDIRKCLYDEISAARCVFISDEAYSFGEFMPIGRHWGRQVVTDHRDVAQRIHSLHPAGQIIMTFRAQIDFIESYYRQRLKSADFEEPFFDFVQREIDGVAYRSMFHLLEYDRCIEEYKKFFGDRSVHKFFYEKIVPDYKLFIEEITQIIGIDTDAAIQIWGGRKLNERRIRTKLDFIRDRLPRGVRRLAPASAVRSVQKYLAVRSEDDVVWDARQLDFCREYFRASNRRLALMTGVDVADLGYPV